MNINVKGHKLLESRIAGAIYGFAIGDAMGATTEFLTAGQIRNKYESITDIVGGGWLNLKPGDVTDDTQMTMCIANAIYSMPTLNTFDNLKDEYKYQRKFIDGVKNNFVSWYNSNPTDVGAQCAAGIEEIIRGNELQENANACGNGSLMRSLPCALIGKLSWNIMQGDLTHPSELCRKAIEIYHTTIGSLIYLENYRYVPYAEDLMEPTGYIVNTLNNALYWSNERSFKDCVLGAVNHGGDADTIAAIAGSISGAKYGFENIPKRWIEQLSPNVKKDLENLKKFVLSYVQN